ncbi:MAG: M23 family metallopeptidase [Candidatus Zixiibacteriota bacterium]
MLRKISFFLILLSSTIHIFAINQPGNSKESTDSIYIKGKETSTSSDISIGFFTEKKKVIPLYYNDNKFWTTNIKLPDMVISNDSENIIKLSGVDIIGKSDKKEVARYKLQIDEVEKYVKRTNMTINNLIKNDELYRLLPLFGKMYIPEGGFSNKTGLNPSESMCIPLSRLLYFHYIGKNKIDGLRANFTFKINSDEKVVEFPIKLTAYQSKGDYIFPLKGSLCIVQNPMCLTAHRQALSQEFAIDIFDSRLGESGEFSTTSKSSPTKLSDYYIFQREIMAIGDGIVEEIGDKFPEAEMSDPRNFSEEFFAELRKQLIPKIGFKNFICGNYIIINHNNGEFSFYGHLSEGSIRVKVGDEVMKGEIIGKVGNTGHSTEPHLHFHLMDSKDFLEANGLPVMFENVPIDMMSIDLTETNSLLYSEFFYIHLVDDDSKK